jgi:hypothetical protein
MTHDPFSFHIFFFLVPGFSRLSCCSFFLTSALFVDTVIGERRSFFICPTVTRHSMSSVWQLEVGRQS